MVLKSVQKPVKIKKIIETISKPKNHKPKINQNSFQTQNRITTRFISHLTDV